MAMPRKVDASGQVVQGKVRGNTFTKGLTSPRKPSESMLKLSPIKGVQTRAASGDRSSPGFLTGHYAACKFAEPPLPSALPLPPQHWMQTTRTMMLPFCAAVKPTIEQHQDIAHQLKLLLKVQA